MTPRQWVTFLLIPAPPPSQFSFLIMEVSWDPVWVMSRSFRVFHGFWLVSMVFQGGVMVFAWCPWFFKVVSWFFMVFGWFPWIFKVVSWFFMVPG